MTDTHDNGERILRGVRKPTNKSSERWIPTEKSMPSWVLSHDADIPETCVYSRYHVTHVFLLLDEAKALPKRNHADYIESIPLQPLREINRLALLSVHCLHKEFRTVVSVGFVVAHVRHGEELGNRSLQILV